MVVTAIRQTSSDRLIVTLDEAEEIKTTLGVVTEHRLYNGAELDDAAAEALRRDSARALARDRALGMVSRRMYSRKELRDKLVQKGEDADTAAYCADWLAENLGVSRIRMELSRRGISRELWEDALAEMPENDSALERYLRQHLPDPFDLAAVRKVSAALYRRGYSWDDIRTAVEQYSKQYEDF